EVLWNQLAQAINQGQVKCACTTCLADIMTYALNRLPPNYVAQRVGAIIRGSRAEDSQFKVDVLTVLTQAINEIGANPKHDSEETLLPTDNEGYIYTCNTQLNVTYASTRASLFTGFQPHAVVGFPFTNLIHADYHQDLFSAANQSTSALTPLNYECIFVRRDKEEYWVNMSISPVVRGSQPVGVVIVLLDIAKHNTEIVDYTDLFYSQEEMEKIRTKNRLSEADLHRKKSLASSLADKSKFLDKSKNHPQK
ncbi:MAG: late competence development ComFB family protein, partial [Candidatus Saccharibacteria bacterium]